MELDKIRCKKCKYYRQVYIHPWSKGIDEKLKRTFNGFVCLLSLEAADDLAFVMLGKTDSIGCECFTQK